jgi:glycosyltransferase involved in cell wall biosynthesis
MLFYCPFEVRKDRYTYQLSAPDTGWNERAWKRHSIPYRRIGGYQVGTMESEGTIFDLPRRSRWCLQQSMNLMRCYNEGVLTGDDIIYFDDALHPGIEAIALAIPKKKRPAMYAWMHGTAVDFGDMLYPENQMWRGYERMVLEMLSATFVACPALKNMLDSSYQVGNVRATGHVWDTEEVMERMGPINEHRDNMVVYASRWDKCKNPDFFLKVAREARRCNVPVKFVVCSSADAIRSDTDQLLKELEQAVAEGIVEVQTGLTKEMYYATLKQAKIIFGCSSMDWTSYVLLEGVAAGAYPVFPDNHCFRDALRGNQFRLYKPGDVKAAVEMIDMISGYEKMWSRAHQESRSWIYKQFDSTWDRRLSIMRLIDGPTEISNWGGF